MGVSVKPKIKIAILDDSQFYLSLLAEELRQYALTLSREKGFEAEVIPCLTAEDFLNSLDPDTSLAYVDYYLGDGKTAAEIMDQVRRLAPNCEVIIISKTRNLNSIQPLWQGAREFIYKDGGSLIQSCLLLKDFIQRRFNA